MFETGIPIEKKTYLIKSKIGDKLEVQIEKLGTGEKADILYRITRGKDRRIANPDSVMLFKEELKELSEFTKEKFLSKEFPE